MKIKNIKCYTMTVLIAATIGFSGCSSDDERFTENKTITEIEIDNNEASLEDENTIKQPHAQQLKEYEINNAMQEINWYFNNSIALHYSPDSRSITIYGPWENEMIPELTDELYEKLNKVLEQTKVQTLEIHRLGNEFDFSKLNLSNIKNITLDNCKIDFNYEPFKNQQYENIILENIPIGQVTEMVENTSAPNTNIDYINLNNSNETSSLIQFLVEKEILLNHLYISTKEFSQQDYSNLSQVKVSNIEIKVSSPANQIYNLEFYPNEQIKSFKIWHIGSNIELGNIQIASNHSAFQFTFNGYDSIITENTHFSLPNHTIVSISSSYSNGDSLKELSNIDKLSYYDFTENKELYYVNDYDDFNQLVEEFFNLKQYQKELQP